jgi:putative ATP-dependent endonuclease of the OLD family
VLGRGGDVSAYPTGEDWDYSFAWYRYLFLGRGKPNTHVHALAGDQQLATNAPDVFCSPVRHVKVRVLGAAPAPTGEPEAGARDGTGDSG